MGKDMNYEIESYREGEQWGMVKGIFYCLAAEAFSALAYLLVLHGLGA